MLCCHVSPARCYQAQPCPTPTGALEAQGNGRALSGLGDKASNSIVEDIGALLREHSSMMRPVPLAADLCRDPDDVKVLGLAVSTSADCILTGDKDLLILKEFQGIPILTPRSFSDILHATGE